MVRSHSIFDGYKVYFHNPHIIGCRKFHPQNCSQLVTAARDRLEKGEKAAGMLRELTKQLTSSARTKAWKEAIPAIFVLFFFVWCFFFYYVVSFLLGHGSYIMEGRVMEGRA